MQQLLLLCAQAPDSARLSVVGVYDDLEANFKLSEHQVCLSSWPQPQPSCQVGADLLQKLWCGTAREPGGTRSLVVSEIIAY